MKVDELIKTILNMVDKQENPEGVVKTDADTKRLKPVEIKNQKGAEQAAEAGDHNAQKKCDGQQIMTFPLQQKHELLKKTVDVPNQFDKQENDELNRIKKMAGLTIIHHDDSTPFDD